MSGLKRNNQRRSVMVNDEGRPYLSLECIRSIYRVQPEKRPTLLIKTNERRLQQKNHRSKKETEKGEGLRLQIKRENDCVSTTERGGESGRELDQLKHIRNGDINEVGSLRNDFFMT